MSEYTQRPWSACKVDKWDEYDVIDAQGYPIAFNLRKDVAHLIASAPDLLAERDRLREAVSWFMGMSGDFPAREAGDPPYWFRPHFRTRFTDICNALQEAGDE